MSANPVIEDLGAGVPHALREAGIVIPDRTPISVLVRTRPVDVDLRAVINSPRVAVRPNTGGNLVLDRNWAEAHVVQESDGSYSVPDTVVRELLAEASAVLDGTPQLELDSLGIGPKPIPGDGEAVVGELDGISGYFVAFTHSGATLALVLGEELAGEVLGQPSELLEPFRPSRFAAV